VQKAFKLLITGIIIGLIIGFPLGINFGRGEPLLSNPFKDRSVANRMTDTVKRKTGELVEGARDKLHDVTRKEQ